MAELENDRCVMSSNRKLIDYDYGKNWDWKNFDKETRRGENPRSIVIVAAAYLDDILRFLIARNLMGEEKIIGELLGTDDKADRPLSTFSAKIKMAYCLGLIDKATYHDFEIIRRIRNKFAHAIEECSFDTMEIVNWCNSLIIGRNYEQFEFKEGLRTVPATPFEKFMGTLDVFMSNWLFEEEKHKREKKRSREAEHASLDHPDRV